MDADYGRIRDKDGNRIDRGEWENALFVLTSVMSHAKPDQAVCDAGLKVQSVDSGLPVIYGRNDVKYVNASDEHGVIEDKRGVLRINEKLKLVPGHCDPPAICTTGMSACATAKSRWSGRCPRAENAIDRRDSSQQKASQQSDGGVLQGMAEHAGPQAAAPVCEPAKAGSVDSDDRHQPPALVAVAEAESNRLQRDAADEGASEHGKLPLKIAAKNHFLAESPRQGQQDPKNHFDRASAASVARSVGGWTALSR